jgi:hypothetical protein
VSDLSTPQAVMTRLAEIDTDLAERQNPYERVAKAFYGAKRDLDLAYARKLLSSTQDSVTEKKADAEITRLTTEGAEHEAEFEATRAVLKLLESRSVILMSILKSQGRA